MDKTKFDVVLYADDKNFVEQLKAAIGLEPGETLNIITPQFKRIDGRVITYFPNTPEEYAALPKLPPSTLRKIGCGGWADAGGKRHWLFPAEWYPHIPAGTPVVAIGGGTEAFEPGVTDNDMRFGYLAYGFLQTKES